MDTVEAAGRSGRMIAQGEEEEACGEATTETNERGGITAVPAAVLATLVTVADMVAQAVVVTPPPLLTLLPSTAACAPDMRTVMTVAAAAAAVLLEMTVAPPSPLLVMLLASALPVARVLEM